MIAVSPDVRPGGRIEMGTLTCRVMQWASRSLTRQHLFL